MRGYLRALCLVYQAGPRDALLFAGLTALAAALQPAQMWLTKVLVDGLAGQPMLSALHLTGVILLLAALWFVSDTSGAASSTLYQLIGFNVGGSIKQKLLRKASVVDYALFEHPHLLDKLMVATGRAESAAINSSFGLANLLRIGLSLAALAGLLARLHPLTPVVIILFSLPRTIWGTAYAQRYFEMILQHTPEHRMASHLGHTLTSPQAAKEVRLFGAGEMLLGRHSALWHKHFRQMRSLLVGMQKWSVLCSLSSAVGVAGVWYYAVSAAMAARISLGDLALYLQTAAACTVGLASLSDYLRQLGSNRLYLSELFGFLDLTPAAIPGALARPSSLRPVVSLKQGIEFRDVWFKYPGTGDFVLAGIDLCIPVGSTLGLVGRNGCGKTTLIKLLTRLYDPTQGEILIDGVPLVQIPPEEYHRCIGAIFQDFVKYELSLRDNVGIGSPSHMGDEAVLLQAIEKGDAASLLARLPNGLDTVLSRSYEGGAELSIGEWQRVAMSRAFAKEEAQVLVLDEPTASLDVFAEQRIFEGFSQLVKGRTAILVSHRLSAVRNLAAIAVMEGGRIVEYGSHEQLMRRGEVYCSMYTAQAQQYGLSGV